MAFGYTGGTRAGGSSTSASVTHGLSISAGNLVVCYLNYNNASASITPSQTWDSSNVETPSGETTQQAMYWMIAGSSEPSAYTFTLGSSTYWTLNVKVFTSATDAEVDSVFNTKNSALKHSSILCEAINGRTISDNALSVIAGGKDNRSSAESYTQATDSYAGIIGNTGNQASAIAHRIFTTGTSSLAYIAINTADSDDSMYDTVFSTHISFVESAGGTTHDLTATSVEADSEVSSPSLGQAHGLTPGSIEASTEVSNPAMGQVHVLSPTHVEAASEVSSPTVGQEHALSATNIEASSEVSAPVLEDIGATHVLEAVGVESASEVSNPSLGQVHSLTVVSVEASSELSVPVVAQVHSLSVVNVESSPEVSSPVVADVPEGTHVLTSVSVEAVASVDAPALAENEAAYVDICTDDTPMIFGMYIFGTGTFSSVTQCDLPNAFGNNLCNTTWVKQDDLSNTWSTMETSSTNWITQRCS